MNSKRNIVNSSIAKEIVVAAITFVAGYRDSVSEGDIIWKEATDKVEAVRAPASRAAKAAVRLSLKTVLVEAKNDIKDGIGVRQALKMAVDTIKHDVKAVMVDLKQADARIKAIQYRGMDQMLGVVVARFESIQGNAYKFIDAVERSWEEFVRANKASQSATAETETAPSESVVSSIRLLTYEELDQPKADIAPDPTQHAFNTKEEFKELVDALKRVKIADREERKTIESWDTSNKSRLNLRSAQLVVEGASLAAEARLKLWGEKEIGELDRKQALKVAKLLAICGFEAPAFLARASKGGRV